MKFCCCCICFGIWFDLVGTGVAFPVFLWPYHKVFKIDVMRVCWYWPLLPPNNIKRSSSVPGQSPHSIAASSLPLTSSSPPLTTSHCLSLPLSSFSLPLTTSCFLSQPLVCLSLPLVCLSLPLVCLSLPLPSPLSQAVTSDSCPPLMTLLWQTASPGFYRPPLKASLHFFRSTHLASLCLSPCRSWPLINFPFYRPLVPKSFLISVAKVVQKYLGRYITFRWFLQHKFHINKT